MTVFSSPILTLLIFLVAQGLGAILLFFLGMDVTVFSLIAAGVNILALLCCHLFLHNMRLATAFDASLIRWHPAMLAVAGGIFGAISISILTDNVELPEAMKQMSLAMSHNFFGLITLIIIGPISEELLFREAIEGEMLRRGASPWTAILVSTLAFSTIHFNLAQGLYALPIGIMFGIIYYKTGNIILTSLLHIINNGIAAAQLNILGQDIDDASFADLFGSKTTAYAASALFALLCIALMTRFWRTYRSRTSTSESQ